MTERRFSLNKAASVHANKAMLRCGDVLLSGDSSYCPLNLPRISSIVETCPFDKDCEKANFRKWATVIRYNLKLQRQNNAKS